MTTVSYAFIVMQCRFTVIQYLMYPTSHPWDNKLLLLLFIHPDPSLLLLLILPIQNNKSVKAPFTHDVWKNTVLGVESCANTALGFASCCICHSTPPLVLYFVDVGLVAGNTYHYAVRGLNSEGPVTGWSDYNASESKVTIGSLDAPVLTLDGSTPNQVSIRWSPVSGAYDYELHRWSESASTWSEVDLTGTPLSHIDRAVVAGETYYYVIRALSESEPHGAWSNYRLDSSTDLPPKSWSRYNVSNGP